MSNTSYNQIQKEKTERKKNRLKPIFEELSKQGYTLKEISKKFDLSPSCIYLWFKNEDFYRVLKSNKFKDIINLEEIKQLAEDGLTMDDVSKQLNIKRFKLYRILKGSSLYNVLMYNERKKMRLKSKSKKTIIRKEQQKEVII